MGNTAHNFIYCLKYGRLLQKKLLFFSISDWSNRIYHFFREYSSCSSQRIIRNTSIKLLSTTMALIELYYYFFFCLFVYNHCTFCSIQFDCCEFHDRHNNVRCGIIVLQFLVIIIFDFHCCWFFFFRCNFKRASWLQNKGISVICITTYITI